MEDRGVHGYGKKNKSIFSVSPFCLARPLHRAGPKNYSAALKLPDVIRGKTRRNAIPGFQTPSDILDGKLQQAA